MKSVCVLKQIVYQGPDAWVDGCVSRMLADGANEMTRELTESGYVIITTLTGPAEVAPMDISLLPQPGVYGTDKSFETFEDREAERRKTIHELIEKEALCNPLDK